MAAEVIDLQSRRRHDDERDEISETISRVRDRLIDLAEGIRAVDRERVDTRHRIARLTRLMQEERRMTKERLTRERVQAAVEHLFVGEPVQPKAVAALVLGVEPTHSAIVFAGRQLTALAAHGHVERVTVRPGSRPANRYAPREYGNDDA
jgi:hypothetical protein